MNQFLALGAGRAGDQDHAQWGRIAVFTNRGNSFTHSVNCKDLCNCAFDLRQRIHRTKKSHCCKTVKNDSDGWLAVEQGRRTPRWRSAAPF
jgi:hypothetical protein